VGTYTLINGDCFTELASVADGSVDCVLCDPPYGTTKCKWDTELDLPSLWAVLKPKLKKNAVVIMFGVEPFSSVLRLSNIGWYKYDLIWYKSKCGSPLTAKYRPLQRHENLSVFAAGKTTYNPQMVSGTPYKRKYTLSKTNNHGFGIKGVETDNKGTRFPHTVLDFPQKWRRQDQVHPTQKPVELLEWLVRTYSNEGETVLDFTMGSGSTGVACVNTGRRFIGVELDKGYFDIAKARIEAASLRKLTIP